MRKEIKASTSHIVFLKLKALLFYCEMMSFKCSVYFVGNPADLDHSNTVSCYIQIPKSDKMTSCLGRNLCKTPILCSIQSTERYDGGRMRKSKQYEEPGHAICAPLDGCGGVTWMFSLNVCITCRLVAQKGSFKVHRGSNWHGAILQVNSCFRSLEWKEEEGGREKTEVKREVMGYMVKRWGEKMVVQAVVPV